MKEYEIKRESGNMVIIVLNELESCIPFKIDRIGVIPKNCRKVRWIEFTDDYTFRSLNTKERKQFVMGKYLEVISEEEMLSIQIKYWESIKPKMSDLIDLVY